MITFYCVMGCIFSTQNLTTENHTKLLIITVTIIFYVIKIMLFSCCKECLPILFSLLLTQKTVLILFMYIPSMLALRMYTNVLD